MVALLVYGSGVVLHEQVHVEIYKSYGIESKIEYFSHFPNAVTIAEDYCPTEECEIQHNLNEIISYNLDILFGIFVLGFGCIIFILEKKE